MRKNGAKVCAQLLEKGGGEPIDWGKGGNFWEITGQTAFQWDGQMRSGPNPGDSWCICMWAFARLIETVGCDSVRFSFFMWNHCGCWRTCKRTQIF